MKKNCIIFLLAFAIDFHAEKLLAQDVERIIKPGDTELTDCSHHKISKFFNKEKATIRNTSNFNYDTLTGIVDLSDILFIHDFKITNSVFLNTPRFYKGGDMANSGAGLSFAGKLNFTKDLFWSYVDFRSCYCTRQTSFAYSQFKTGVDFTYSVFVDTVYFKWCVFGKAAHFLCKFGSFVDFSDSRFSDIAFFSNMNLTENTIFAFTNATLPDTLDFSDNNNIPHIIELTDADFNSNPGKKHQIYLNRSEIAKFHLDYSHFKILFKNPKFPHDTS